MRSGFSLLEFLLVTALLVVLAAMAMPLFGNALAHHQLAESAERFRSLMYLTGAEARQSGRRLELSFITPLEANYLTPYATTDKPVGSAYGNVAVQVERDPLGSPGTFDALAVDWAAWSSGASTVQIGRVEISEPIPLAGGDSSQELGSASQDQNATPTILFGPDGRSEVGDVTVTMVNDRLDGYLVQLRGPTGLATIKPMPAVKKNQ